MTNEDAWANLQFLIEPDSCEIKEDYIEEIELAIKALKKQIPYKVKKIEDDSQFAGKYICPECGCIVETNQDFCHVCGQGLNWIGVDDDK